MNLKIRLVLEHFPTSIARAGTDDVLVVDLLHVTLQCSSRTEDLEAAFALEVLKHLGHVRMHPFDMDLELLRLTKFSSAQVAQRPTSLRIF